MIEKQKLEDYRVVKKLGEGSFGEILLVQADLGNKVENYAMKKISQKQIIKVDKMHEPFIQRQILMKFTEVAPDYFVNMFQTHSDAEYIYMILELCEGGSLQEIIADIDKIENRNETIRHIIAKIALILEMLHKYGVLHRDIKPSNFLLHKNGTIKLADFGTAFASNEFYGEEVAKKIAHYKKISQDKKRQRKMSENEVELEKTGLRRATFVGTTFYMPPELLSEDYYGVEADYWGLGCIAFQLIYKKTPFQDENEGMVWKKILNDEIPELNTEEIIPHSNKFIMSLLQKDRSKRLGHGPEGPQNIRDHPFFEGLDWQAEKNFPLESLTKYYTAKKSEPSFSKTMNKQKILLSGVIMKKMFFGNFKERMLVLNSQPKLIYYDLQTNEKKGEIQLTQKTPIVQDGKNFTVTTDKKTYHFKSPKAAEWVEMMKYAVVTKYY